jgi:hypothetical protein
MPPSMKVHVHWMNLMKNQIIQKIKSLHEKVTKQRTHLKNYLIKKLCWMGSKILALNVGHMWKK